MALERKGGVDEVCEAIDRLVNCGVMLDLSDINRLLTPDHDEAIRTYALALIPNSVDCEEAMAVAQDMAGLDEEGAFAEEFRMMKNLMSNSVVQAS